MLRESLDGRADDTVRGFHYRGHHFAIGSAMTCVAVAVYVLAGEELVAA